MSLSTRTLRLSAAALTVLSLTGVSACSISLGGGTDAATTQAAPSDPVTSAAPETSTPATPTAEATTAAPTPETSGPATEESSSDERPGAAATIVDEDWLSTEEFIDKTISAGNGTVLISENNGYIRVEGDVTTLTVTGANNDVFVDYVDTLVIDGGNATVYVRDVKTVVINGANAEVVWAGDTPVINDFGSNTTTRRQGEDG